MKITNGIQLNPAARVVIYGVEGIGKTTLASKLDRPYFIDFEGGTAGLNVSRTWRDDVPRTLAELYAIIEELRRDPHHAGYQTLVIDGANAIEALLKADILGDNPKYETIEQLLPYGKASIVLSEKVGAFLDELDRLVNNAGMDVCIVCHSVSRTFTLPGQTDSFDRYELMVEKKSAALYRAWADILLFVNYWTDIETNEKGKARAVGGRRYAYTTHHATYEGKHREPFPLPDKLPLDDAALLLPKVIAAGVSRPTVAEAAPQTAPKPVPAAVVNVDKPTVDLPNPNAPVGPMLSKVRDLMVSYQIGVEELRSYIAEKGVCPEPVWQFEEIPEPFAAWLVGGWQKAIAKKIIASRGNPNK